MTTAGTVARTVVGSIAATSAEPLGDDRCGETSNVTAAVPASGTPTSVHTVVGDHAPRGRSIMCRMRVSRCDLRDTSEDSGSMRRAECSYTRTSEWPYARASRCDASTHASQSSSAARRSRDHATHSAMFHGCSATRSRPHSSKAGSRAAACCCSWARIVRRSDAGSWSIQRGRTTVYRSTPSSAGPRCGDTSTGVSSTSARSSVPAFQPCGPGV